ncbi:MAG: hypothetical protein F6K17_35795 [Okeania sp. SIO3C4]|nr:hypothetical protein [Okeania sp. SIO3B3]NER07551.1 hypothetical protein [Okeania sp. SIO3C4]
MAKIVLKVSLIVNWNMCHLTKSEVSRGVNDSYAKQAAVCWRKADANARTEVIFVMGV